MTDLLNAWPQAKKIITLSQAKEIVAVLKENGKIVGFTNGCFDCCHLGHLNSFVQAKKLCDVLIVAVNSDASVKRYKGENRPIQDEMTRALLLASMDLIDYVIIFGEDTPLHIVDALRPDIVAKEGYTLDRWPEGRLVQSYGGKAVTLDRLEGYSTSYLVEKMQKEEEGIMPSSKALFLDRDGTINVDYGYVYRQKDFHLIDGILDLCKKAEQKGYLIIVITNQSGIARGYYSDADFQKLNDYMIDLFKQNGVKITDVFYCPDLQGFRRKPECGMFIEAQNKYDIDMALSVCVGDKERDIQAGQKAGVGKNLLFTGNNFDQIMEEL